MMKGEKLIMIGVRASPELVAAIDLVVDKINAADPYVRRETRAGFCLKMVTKAVRRYEKK